MSGRTRRAPPPSEPEGGWEPDMRAVDQFVADSISEASTRGMRSRELLIAIERLHLDAAYRCCAGDVDELAEYMRRYGSNVSQRLDDGSIQISGWQETVMH